MTQLTAPDSHPFPNDFQSGDFQADPQRLQALIHWAIAQSQIGEPFSDRIELLHLAWEGRKQLQKLRQS